ncbi:hypothetical protein EKL85_21530 [Salmonella enterica subsp. enterica serovar Give]|nr:hypothetical protein [Salmonella enterica subsp. enterica serovar Give]ECA4141863.1 hypothetical protein [Salmonella enterica subsp. enterica serovar Give]
MRTEPPEAATTEEPVTYDPGETWAFSTRASRQTRWLTGPGNSEQLQAEQRFDPDEIYGGTG